MRKATARLMGILLAIAILIPMMSNMASADFNSDWKTWSQGGSKLTYKSNLRPDEFAFKKFGCHFMAHCKLMAEAGIIDPKSFNPDSYFEWIVSKGKLYIGGKQYTDQYGTDYYAIGEKEIGRAMIDYVGNRATITRNSISLSGLTADQKKALIQANIKNGYYIILDCDKHETYVMHEESKSKGVPWISDSGSKYGSVSYSSGIYAYKGYHAGDSDWEEVFDKAYLYSVNGSGKGVITSTGNSGNSGTGNSASVSCTVSTVRAEKVSDTSYTLYGTASSSGAAMTECGMYIGTSTSNMTQLGFDRINLYKTDMWYNTQKFGYTLKPGTTYYYQAYAFVNGKEYKAGNVESFTTPSPSGAKSVSLNRTSLTMKDTECIQLTATTSPANQAVTWSSSDSSVATVVGGSVTALKKGTATITASLASDSSVKAQCVVSVTESTAVNPQIVLNRTSLTMKATECIQLTATTTPANQTVTWRSGNSSIATVTGGSVTALKAGTVLIMASMSYEGKTYETSCQVTVQSTPGTVNLSHKGASGITQTTARVDASCSYTGTRPSSVGLYLGTSTSNMSVRGSDAINHNQNPFDIWYNLSGLSANTTYYYQFYAVVNGQTVWSDTKSFKTDPTPASTPAPTNTVKLTHKGASSITQTTARVDASCSYTGTHPSSVGLYLGTSMSNMSSRGSDTINHNQNPFDIWYNLSGLSAGTTYYYRFYAVVNGETVWSDTKSFKTDSTPAPAMTPTSTVNLTHKGASSITQTTARVDASCSYTGTHPSSVGIFVGTSTSDMSSRGVDLINHNQNPFDIWYNLSGLSAGTTYYYRFYAVVNGETTWSDTRNFTTAQAAQTNTVSLTHKGVSSITQSTARVDASCSYTGTRPSSVGLYLGTSTSSMSYYGSDNIDHNKNPFDIWYNLKGLSAGTTYYYRFYAVVNGQTIWSDTRSFTT